MLETLEEPFRRVENITRSAVRETYLNSTIYCLGHLGQMSWPLWASVSFSIKRGSKYLSDAVGVGFRNKLLDVKCPSTGQADQTSLLTSFLPKAWERTGEREDWGERGWGWTSLHM